MERQGYLLHLPFELRDMIWASSATTGDANGLMRCCRQILDEFSRQCNLPNDITKLVKLSIWVDSTYIHGSWLKFEYCWEEKGHTYRAIETVRDRDDQIAQRLLEMTHAEEIVVHFQAPRRGHFVGALFMMLAKADDVYHLISNMSKDTATTDPSNITIRFSTEPVQPGQLEKEAKNFWECRSAKVLQESIRNHICHDNCSMPCFYEYFLINHPVTFAHPPKIEFCSWPRTRAHIQSTKKRCPNGVEFMVREIGQKESLKCLAKFRDFRDELAVYSAKMMTELRNRDNPNDQTRRYWEANDYGAANLKYRFQFLLDNLAGPVGGCLDMLRLHRFKTMGASEANFFAREEQTALKKFASLSRAAPEINNRLKILFNPLASKDIRKLRTSCPHLSAVPWATDPSAEASPRQYCLSSEWLKNYPKGIRYSWNGRDLAEWRFQWATSECEARDPDVVWLNKWWDCLSCCEDSACAMGTLSLRFEGKVSSKWDEFFHRSPHNGLGPWHCCCHWDFQYLYRPVMVRR
ncbi:hypothetical protein B0J15DRAFT_457835 [Fusarium solani]|uniref:Uncharacterized protein n=1 Tax=Fusarium solani TaxID=169388 RepID=A0A9P9RF32_FUSSL|nr:uncharacterized protein B0J15DRAFT_457835 [Fusarium solani]KAH7275680.1 hypothetical protein B0J15DRAFT_457835 [Fusarium solani]